MTDFAVRIPHRSSGESLAAVAGYCRLLPTDEERDVARQLVLGQRLRGVATAGELLDRLDAMQPHERRALLDEARSELGLPTTAKLEAEARWQAAQGRGLTTSSAFTFCSAPGCEAVATRAGALIRPDQRRWFCEAHADQATAEDLLPRDMGVRRNQFGAIVPVQADELARAEAEAASRAARDRATAAARAAEVEQTQRHREAQRAARDRALPWGPK